MPDRRGAALLLLLLSVVIAFAFQGSHGLFDPSEGRYAEVAREMLESGNFLEPTLDFQPHFTKPPLTYWAAAAGLKLFGRNAWGARFANAVAFLLTVQVVAAIGAQLWDRRAGFLSGLVYLSSPFVAVSAAFLTTDTLLTLWEALAVFAFVAFWRSDSAGRSRMWIRLMWFFFGVAFSTKGPPGLLPLLVILVFGFGLSGRRRLFDPLGIALFVVAGFWWYVVVSLRNPGLLGYFIRDEIIGRSFTEEFHRNTQWYAPFILYVPVIVFGTGPWVVEAIRGARDAFAAWRVNNAPLWGHRGEPRRLLILWIVLPLVILSLSKSRLPLYVLPLCVPLALAVAAAARHAGKRRLVALATASIMVCLAGKAAIPLVDQRNNAKLIHDAAVAAGGQAARYAFLNERRMYGVQFYFNGEIERVSTTPGQEWADRDLQWAVNDIQSSPPTSSLVFITHSAGATAVEAAVAGLRVQSTRKKLFDKDIITVTPMP
jgi:4-amino-4-deoxy-L-arabinose transferase-like glycosyltransferase